MSRRAFPCVPALALVVALISGAAPRAALANGRPPGTSTIHFRKGMERHVYAGMTFGAVLSKDGGATWEWICEEAIGYSGTYDPDYVFAPDGTIFATTFDGLKANRDGCVYGPTPHGSKFVASVAQGPDDALYVAMAQAANELVGEVGDARIYRSTDGGLTFPLAVSPGQVNDWWQSIEVAPSDPNRVYLFGYRLTLGEPKLSMVFRSGDRGETFESLPVTDFAVMTNSTIEIAGISRSNPNLLYARVTLEDDQEADGLYRSRDGGQSWQKILSKAGSLAFVVRASGELVAGTQQLGAWRSTDEGDTWQALPNPPRISCLVENAAGEVWACTQNYGVPPDLDGFGIMKSTDLTQWTGVLRYQDLVGPVMCPADTEQELRCNDPDPRGGFCGLCLQLGCTPMRDCTGADVTPPDPPKKKGCCGGEEAKSPMVVGMLVGLVILRPRRRARGDRAE